MSENLNRSNPDFSKYDIMSIGELEEILRADAQGPERDDSDVDEILYVMEVLAKKRRQNGIAGKTALEAYQEFQQHYHPMVEEQSMPKHKCNLIPFRRIAAIAACLVLVFSFATSANAFCFRDVWNSVVTWAQETFSFSMGTEVSEPSPTDTISYISLQDALTEGNIPLDFIPTWIPPRFELHDVSVSDTPLQKVYIAFYLCGEETLKISIKSYMISEPEQIEISNGLLETYSSLGTDYYICKNNELIEAMWITKNFECYFSGNISIDEAKLIIDSIKKG